ncbi:hypothetical protein SEA_A3WALLY_366 [Microbacterium phage A3Wally]|nr:hypothetical protein SEA_A3WALLY_12 [Microbacterium phage A3Wally]QWY84173.1 hypothetical protein SEA_A3WALLY_366 [Microbacterium phage A3Wally]
MTPLHYCAVCGTGIDNVYGNIWMHWVRPDDNHRAELDTHREDRYDGDMSTREVRAAELALAEAERAVASARLKLERTKAASALPPEPARDTTLQIKVQYRPGETTYTYIAYRTAAGHWLVTGQRYADKKLTWEDVVKLADKNHNGRAHLRILS